MEIHCVTCNKNTAKKYSARTSKQKRLLILSNCAVFDIKKSRFITNQETSRLELYYLVL